MARFSLKDHFTWMLIAGVVIAANGVIQSVGGTQPLGLISLVVGILLVGLGLVRPRAMARDRAQTETPTAAEAAGKPSRRLAALGLLLVVISFAIALYAGLPVYFRDGFQVSMAETAAIWIALVLGIALLAFDRQRRAPAGGGSVALIIGIVLGLLAVGVATTTAVRTGVVALWKAANPAQHVLIYAIDPTFDDAPRELLLAESVIGLGNFLEANGQFHPPRRIGGENLAVLLAATDPASARDFADLIASGYLGFHFVHDDSVTLAASVAQGAPAPDGYRLIGADDGPLLIKSEPDLTGAAVVAQRVSSDARGDTVVDVTFDPAGRTRLAEMTAENIGRRLAIVSGGRAIMAPVIREEIAGGTVQISGNLTTDDALSIVRALYLGALPAPLVLVSQEIIGQ